MSVVLLLSRKRSAVVRTVLVTLAALVLAACSGASPTAPEVDVRRTPLVRSTTAPDSTPRRDPPVAPRDSSSGSGGTVISW